MPVHQALDRIWSTAVGDDEDPNVNEVNVPVTSGRVMGNGKLYRDMTVQAQVRLTAY